MQKDVAFQLWRQSDDVVPTTGTTVTMVPTRTFAAALGGAVLPAPIAQQVPASGYLLIENVETCEGTQGWYWRILVNTDGAVIDERNVLVPASATSPAPWTDLPQIRDDMRSLTADQVYVGLEDDPPPDYFRGWWLVSAQGNPALGDDTGSGDLRRIL